MTETSRQYLSKQLTRVIVINPDVPGGFHRLLRGHDLRFSLLVVHLLE
jgi:hypothetical protein